MSLVTSLINLSICFALSVGLLLFKMSGPSESGPSESSPSESSPSEPASTCTSTVDLMAVLEKHSAEYITHTKEILMVRIGEGIRVFKFGKDHCWRVYLRTSA